MTLKKKLTTLITMFVLVVAMAIVGVYAATSATINMGGSISFQASGVYAQLTGGISGGNDKTFNPLLFTEADANSPSETDKETWNNNDLSLTKENPTRTITVTVENLSTERSMYVMIEDVGEVENITKSVTVPGNNNAANKGIEVAKKTSVTYTIKLSITNTNNSVNGRYEYIIHLSDEPIASKINIQAFSNNEELGTVTGGVKGVEENQEVTLTATPNGTNQQFLGWATEKDIKNIVSIEPTYSFTYEEGIPTNYYAVFNETTEQQTTEEGITYKLYKEAKLAEVVSSEGATLTGELDLSNGVWFNSEKYKIYSIGDSGFINQQITGVVIPKTVTKIGMAAFAYTRLESVTIPSSVVEIGDAVFGMCVEFDSGGVEGPEDCIPTLSEINLEEGNKNYYVDVVDGKGVALISNDGKLIAYADACLLTQYSIPQGVKLIGAMTFSYAHNIESLYISKDVEVIGDSSIAGAFGGLTKLTEIIFEEGSKLIEIYGSFMSCTQLTEITLPTNLEKIQSSFDGSNINNVKIKEGNQNFVVLDSENYAGKYELYYFDGKGNTTLIIDDLQGTKTSKVVSGDYGKGNGLYLNNSDGTYTFIKANGEISTVE